MEEKPAFEIPVEGSLGLLAMGYAGMKLWREKRAAHEKDHGKYENFMIVEKKRPDPKPADEQPEETR